ncbi:MAG: 16S rRNA (uracil(1498)-N(3))-methyltransferase [Chloracidobacterium sp.]|uniref:Ribosomal RNA small subunit methyltransferase E n=1 Tax=Chloracidobacterium validum TaxID=2821543 RepID=A0ABX8B6X9_9BACT|nr:16S rRNA (uracil(1498)-N(3))-methyltransferase [Chloracidobacterium validum]QUW02192.1 16S rRNA (uracil(1498)-N(3))-methyltransferase [Chloracidobacterium validum]
MPGHRFYAPLENFTAESVCLPDDEAHHARQVLRVQVGETVSVFDGCGRVFQATVAEVSKRRVRLTLGPALPVTGESPLALTLGVALLKSDKFEWVIQKAVELGVTCIIPLTTRHVEPSVLRGASERLERWRRIGREATKQCGRSHLTAIASPHGLADVLTMPGVKFFFTERQGVDWSMAVNRVGPCPAAVVALVGPEGGWSESEQALAEAHNAVCLKLGPRILRAETAAILAVGLLQSAFGDFVVNHHDT